MATPAPSLRVYRSGPIVLPSHREPIARLYARVDALRPPGRPGRGAILFCSPSLFGASRWFRANLWVDDAKADVAVREIRLAASDPLVYVYPVAAWERASNSSSTEADIRVLWAAGVPLAAWAARAAAEGWDPRNWEVLVPLPSVLGARPVADARVLASIPISNWAHGVLEQELKLARRVRRW
jgi:hypothetical protein